MRIAAIEASDVLPVRRFQATKLSDVVVIAGPNGVGKSRLIEGLLQKFQGPRNLPGIRLLIEATCPEERLTWGKGQLDTAAPAEADLLTRSLQKNRSRRQWNSSVIHFESDRSIQQITPYQFSWNITDPWLENVGWNQTFGGLKARFNDTLHSLFRKVQSHEKEIAKRALELQKSGQDSMPLDFADPLKPFKDAFSLLLAPKKLLDPDPKSQQLFYEYDSKQFPLTSLSSGEREVVNIVFDFILRTSSDCVIFFDEPELHLHPELSYKLLQALRATGARNQFVFCTHSPDIITASLDQSVIFLAPPRLSPTSEYLNQAIPVTEDDSTNEALKLLGHSVGVVALGRRLVLIEGTSTSLDKQTYGLLLKNRFPDLVLVPTGGKDLIRSFGQVVQSVLEKSIWGVDFFMLCDRDAADQEDIQSIEANANGKLRFLRRYHLENYFLNSTVISRMFFDLEPPDSWLRNPTSIDLRLREIASGSLSYATALIVSSHVRRRAGNASVMPKAIHDMHVDALARAISERVDNERQRLHAELDGASIDAMARGVFAKLQGYLQDASETWKTEIPGKPILGRLAAVSGLELGRFKTLYLATAEREGLPVFQDVISIFQEFSGS